MPAVCVLEVFKVVARQRGNGDALRAVAVMQQATWLSLTARSLSPRRARDSTIACPSPTAESFMNEQTQTQTQTQKRTRGKSRQFTVDEELRIIEEARTYHGGRGIPALPAGRDGALPWGA